MNMYLRQNLLDSPTHAQIRLTSIFWVNAALHTDLGSSTLPCLFRTPDDLIQCKIIGGPTQILAELAFGKGTELATKITNIGVVDVPVHNVRNDISIDLLAHGIRSLTNRSKIITTCLK